MVRINTSNVPDGETFEPVPAGRYNLVLEKWGEQTSGNGKQFINCEFVINDGDFAGRKIWDKFFLTEASWWRLKQLARAIDFDKTDSAEGFEHEELFRSAVNCAAPIVAQIVIEPYKDKKGVDRESNKIDSYQSRQPVDDSDTPF